MSSSPSRSITHPFPLLKDALGFQDIIIDARHTFQGTMFKDVGADAGQLLERDDEDNEANFVLGGQRRFYDQRRPRRQGGGKRSSRRMHRGYGAIPIDDGQGGSGGGVGSSSDAGEHGGYGYEVDEEEPLEFPDELDADVESEYLQSRELVFGDMNFPVVHEDPRFREPPQIQQEILKKASTFSFDRLPALAGGGDGVGASSSFSAATAAINIFPSHAPSSTLNPVPTHSSSFGSSSTSSISSHRQLRQPTTYGSGSSTKVLFNPESFKSSKH